MAIVIREGNVEDVLKVANQIEEFSRKETKQSLFDRLAGKKSLILIAEENGQPLGFKAGYEITPMTFYSWFGGVISVARKKGVAQQLLDAQERWTKDNGYSEIKVKSSNQFPSMLRLLSANGYLIESKEENESIKESKIKFIKLI